MAVKDVNNVIDFLSLSTDDFVQSAYSILLGRAPSAIELQSHAGALRRGIGRSCLLQEITLSAEYSNWHHNMMYGQSDDDFIIWLYQRFMNRAPDPLGLAHYGGRLSRGKGREQIRKDIFSSVEARSISNIFFEIDHLLERERMDKPRWRWLRRNRPRYSRHHQEHEVILRGQMLGEERLYAELSSVADNDTLALAVAAKFQAEQSGGEGAPNLASISNSRTTSASPLAKVDMGALGRDARRVVKRLQHAKGYSMQERGIS